VLLPLVAADPGLRNTGEALVRLRALDRKLIGGIDLDPSSHGLVGFVDCKRGVWRHDWDFLHRTQCNTDRDRVSLRANVPDAVADAEATTLLLALRRSDASSSIGVELHIGNRIETLHVDGAWNEVRVILPKGSLPKGSLRAELKVDKPGARLAVDHLLLVPRASPSS
jgi:hypothetical protein